MATFCGRPVAAGRALVMAIVNRTPDSFYDRGATFTDDAAMEAVHRVVAEGAREVNERRKAARLRVEQADLVRRARAAAAHGDEAPAARVNS
jgi:dihydropteroate synthase